MTFGRLTSCARTAEQPGSELALKIMYNITFTCSQVKGDKMIMVPADASLEDKSYAQNSFKFPCAVRVRREIGYLLLLLVLTPAAILEKVRV